MNLLQVLHQRWLADETLNGLLPADRVFTGISPDRTLPRAEILKPSQRPLTLPGDGSAIDNAVVQFRVFHNRYDDGAEILQQIKATFDRIAFNLEQQKKVFNMQPTRNTEKQHDDGVWEFTLDFDCTLYLPDGV